GTRAESPDRFEAAATAHLLQTARGLERAEEDKTVVAAAATLDQHVEEPVDSVIQVDVGGAGRVAVQELPGAAAYKGVAGLVAFGRIGLRLHNASATAAPDQLRADQLAGANQRR